MQRGLSEPGSVASVGAGPIIDITSDEDMSEDGKRGSSTAATSATGGMYLFGIFMSIVL